MKIADVRARAFAMPLNNPSYPPGPYHFYDREYFVVEYLTDPNALRAVVPEPLEITDPIVKFEFIRLPDTTGFGDFTECGQMIPVSFRGEKGIYVHSMYLDDEAPIAAAARFGGFRRNWRVPRCATRARCLSVRCISARCSAPWGAWGISTRNWITARSWRTWRAEFPSQDHPNVDCGPRICELVRYRWQDVSLKGAWGVQRRFSSLPMLWEMFRNFRSWM